MPGVSHRSANKGSYFLDIFLRRDSCYSRAIGYGPRESSTERPVHIRLLLPISRQVLIGRLILGYDVATVAQMIGKNANAVKALQFRALQSLQRLLGKHDLSERAFHVHAGRKEEAP